MSYARLVRFSVTPGDEAPVRALAIDLVPEIQRQPGCESALVFIDDDGQAGIFVLWDSQDHAQAAAAVIRPQLDRHLSGSLTSQPEPRLFRVVPP
jgi:quinol monooxygenase YgiN